MTFSDWYYNRATAEERAECREMAERTKELPPMQRLRERTRYKLQKLLKGKGGTVVTDTSHGYMKWRITEAEDTTEEMQFGSVGEALTFCREETQTVADWLGSIVPVWLVLPDGEEVAL